jgi:hypothetical protein
MTDETIRPDTSGFTVAHFKELMAQENAMDIYSLRPTEAIGVRGEALIGSFSGMFQGSVKDMSQKLGRMPLAIVKGMLQDIVTENLVSVREAIQKEFEGTHSDDDIKKAVVSMAANKKFLLTVELPSKTTAKFTPLTADKVAKMTSQSRLDLVLSVLVQIGEELKSKTGVEQDLLALPYADFEYLYAYIDLVNIRLSRVNWKDLIKNL